MGSNLKSEIPLSLVTHLPLQSFGGGVFAVTWQIHRQLVRHFPVVEAVSLATPTDWYARFWSRLNRRVLRRSGTFYTFSHRTLDEIAALVSANVSASSRAIFFRSSTRWSQWRPDRPYFVHTDVCFHTFYENTFRPDEFCQSDLQRIWQLEAKFLDRAAAVFFESGWGLEKTKLAYGVAGKNFFVVPNAGAILPPATDQRQPDGRFRLITMAKHFRQKGGDWVADAYKRLKLDYPQLCWHILGGEPDARVRAMPDVHYEGFLRPNRPEELARMRQLLSSADLLVHPTREDTNPLVLVEAASFGCPAVSTRAFAIPELVVDRQTGLLLEPPLSAAAVQQAIEFFLRHPLQYQQYRKAARERAIAQYSWDMSGDRIAAIIQQRIS